MGENLLTFLIGLGELAADIMEAKFWSGRKKKEKKKGMERKNKTEEARNEKSDY